MFNKPPRVKYRVNHHHQQHRCSVEGVDESFVPDNIPVLSLHIFYRTYDASDDDQNYDDVYGPEVVLPVDGGIQRQDLRRVLTGAPLRVPRDQEEYGEGGDLGNQAAQDDRLAELDGVRVAGCREDRADELRGDAAYIDENV